MSLLSTKQNLWQHIISFIKVIFINSTIFKNNISILQKFYKLNLYYIS